MPGLCAREKRREPKQKQNELDGSQTAPLIIYVGVEPKRIDVSQELNSKPKFYKILHVSTILVLAGVVTCEGSVGFGPMDGNVDGVG
jgi:hypothetical protein